MKLKRLSLIMVLALGFLTFGTLFATNSTALLGLGKEVVPTREPAPAFPDAKKITSNEPADLAVPGRTSPNHLTHPCAGFRPEPLFSGLSPLSIGYVPGMCSSGYGDIGVWQADGHSYVVQSGFAQRMFHLWNVDDPYNPVHLITQNFPAGGTASTAAYAFQQFGSHYIAVTMRGSGTGCGYFIYNVNNPSAPVFQSRTAGADWCTVHETIVSTDANGDADYAWLTMSTEAGSGTKIVALTLPDLRVPGALPVETGRYNRPGAGSNDPHDSNVVGNRVYVGHWSGGMQIFDKQTLATTVQPNPLNPPGSIDPAGFAVHHVVPTTDGRFAFIEDEFLTASNQQKVQYYNIEDLSAPFYVGGIIGEGEAATSQAHNLRIMNVSPGHDILFVGWYKAGTRIFDVDTSGPSIVVTQRATHQVRTSAGSGFGGTWGVDYLPCTVRGQQRTCVYSSDYQGMGLIIDALDYDPMLDPYDPESAVTDPTNNQAITGCTYTIQGTAHDYYSGVASVEVSTDDGATWQPAQGTTTWTYAWNIPGDGAYAIKSRAIDVAGNVQEATVAVNVTVSGCILLTPTASSTPPTSTSVPTTAVPTTTSTTVPTTAVPSQTTTSVATTAVPTMTRTATSVVTASTTTTPCSGMVTICHRTGNGNSHTITVSCAALAAHMAHGDTMGTCPQGTPRAQPNRFSDVNQGDFFFDFVLDLNDDGAISGYNDGTFRPYNQATRAQLVKIVVLAFHMPLYAGNEQSFSDVPTSHTFYREIETAQRAGLVGGYSDGTFRPFNNVTRGQIAKIAVEAAGMEDLSNGGQTFSDVPVGSTFHSYIETAYANGILSGYSDGTFRPNNDATRGQVAKIVDIATHPGESR